MATAAKAATAESPAERIPPSAATVTVACKLPAGLVLRIFEMIEGMEQTPLGARKIQRAQQVGPSIRIKGNATPFGVVREDPLAAGYALTRGVPADFWKKWLEDNKDSDLVQARLIFAAESTTQVQNGAVRMHKEGIKSGLEPIDPKNPPKLGRYRVQVADEMPAHREPPEAA